MVFKILSRHSPGFRGLIDYILKERKGEGQERPEPILHNFRGQNQQEWVRELYQNEAFRSQQRKGQVYLYHAILSFSNLDSGKIHPEMLSDITNKFIELRGKEGMYLASPHFDKEHVHIHCLIAGTEYKTGKAFRMTKEELQELKIELQDYQQRQYPELENSVVQHGLGKTYLSPAEYRASKNTKTFMKSELSQRINDILTQSTSEQNFLEQLRENGLHHYERGGKTYGITADDGKNYRFSTLNVDMQKFQALDQDLSEEEQALEEIQTIRNDMENTMSIEQDDPQELDLNET